jgi:hypothetical protein
LKGRSHFNLYSLPLSFEGEGDIRGEVAEEYKRR